MTTASTHRPVIEPASPPTLTCDELRAIARLTGATLPPILLGYEPGDHTVEAAAVRSLIARGAVVFNRDGDRPVAELSTPTRQALDPLLRADELVEIDWETPAGSERHVFAAADGAGLRLSEAEPDVWVLNRGLDLADVLAAIVEELDDADEPCAPHPAPFSVTISPLAHEHVEMLMNAEQADEAEAALVDDGVSPADAGVLAGALGHRVTETAVRRAARDADGGFVAAENCWFNSGDHGWWLVHPADPFDSLDLDDEGDELGDPDDEPLAGSTFHRTTRAAIRAALANTIADTVSSEG